MWRSCGEGKDFERVLQVIENLINDGRILNDRNDTHLGMTLRTKERIGFVNELHEGSPGGFPSY